MKALREAKAWAVAYGNGYIDLHSVRPLRRQAVEAFVSDPAVPSWDYWRKQGCRCVRVRVLAVGEQP